MNNKKCSDCGNTKSVTNFSHNYESDICNGCANVAATKLLTYEQVMQPKRCNSSGNHSPLIKDFIRPSGKRGDGALRENKTCNHCDKMSKLSQARNKNKPKMKREKGQHHFTNSHPFDSNDLLGTSPLGFAMLAKPLIVQKVINY